MSKTLPSAYFLSLNDAMLAKPSLLIGCGFRRPHCLYHCLASRATLWDALCREGEMHCRSLADALARALSAGVDQHKSYTCGWHCVW